MRVYLHSFNRCCLPNMPTSAKFRENLNLQQFKVIQGRDFDTNRKRMCEFLLVINSNFGPILHRFWDTATYWLKIAYFCYPFLGFKVFKKCFQVSVYKEDRTQNYDPG